MNVKLEFKMNNERLTYKMLGIMSKHDPIFPLPNPKNAK